MDASVPDDDPVALRRAIAAAAQAYLDGLAGATETARSVTKLAHKLDASLSDLLTGFTGVDSETDTLPLGNVRAHWNEDALAREDQAREPYEAQVAVDFTAMCQQVVAVFGHAPPNNSFERSRDR